MKLFDYINELEYREMVSLGYIDSRCHPTFSDYRIICYTRECNYEKIWNDTTTKCRGIIVDGNDNIIARPFQKFYNYEEYDDPSIIPDEKFEVYEKLDGSLGILYWINDVPFISTKGSFTSDQALHATGLLHTKYKDKWNMIDRTKTYLFEIIYPGDLNCVSYNDIDDIFLLAIIDIETGKEEHIKSFNHPFQTTKWYQGVTSWKTLRQDYDGTNREGFVIKFVSGLRIKMKYESYWRIHFLKAGFSPNKILQHLKDGTMDVVNDAMQFFDEEHRIYYQRIIDVYTDAYAKIIDTCIAEMRDDFVNEREAAEYILTCKYPHVMFPMRKGMSYHEIVWKYVEREVKFNNFITKDTIL